jgi:quercetin dioxygenase-like cupin family protein
MSSTDDRIVRKAALLRGLLEYQENSIVSRTLIDRKVGTVSVFAFDEGQALSEHQAPYDALVYVLEGEAEIVISKKGRTVKNGEIIIMPGGEPHSLRAVSRFKMMLVLIRE